MNFPLKSLERNKRNISNKVTTLNPNAAEFVPSSLRSPHGNTKSADSSRGDPIGTSGTALLGRSESSVSDNSDDEAHQYWRCQLPDDITPDFKAVGEDEVPRMDQLSLAGLSIHGGLDTSRFSASIASETFAKRQGKSPLGTNNINPRGSLGYSGSMYAQDGKSAPRITPAINSWGKRVTNGELTSGIEGHGYNVDSSAGLINDLFGTQPVGEEPVREDAAVDTLEFLVSRFPGFSAENLADMYYANRGDLNSMIKMLSQYEIQENTNNQNLSLESSNIRRWSNLDLHKVQQGDAHNGLSMYSRDPSQSPDRYRSSSGLLRSASDYASTVRKGPPQDGIHWNHERNHTADGSVGSRTQFLGSFNNGHGKLLYGDSSPRSVASRAAPIWLATGEAVANAYSETREEVRDLESLRDACLEQASQAYLVGNKALARELGEKGSLYTMQVKAAKLNAEDTVYQKRDPVSYEFQGYGRGGQEHIINLHGYNVSDALVVLRRELNALRNTALTSRQQLQATIFLGTGQQHSSRSPRTSARLPMVVEQFLLGEGLPYTQSEPGFLHVVIY